MKKILFYLSLMAFVSCTIGVNQSKEKTETQKLAEFFLSYDQYSANNSIQEDELYNRRESDLMRYQDSAGVFNNLEGRVERLYSTDFAGAKIVELEIEVPIKPDYDKITVRILEGIDPDSLDTNEFYQMVKDLPLYGKVYFDGVISQNVDNGMPHNEKTSKSIRFPYPHYDFLLMNISTAPCDTLGADLRNAIIAGRKSVNNIFKEYRKEIVPTQEEDVKVFNNLRDILNEKDQKTLEKYMILIASDMK